MRHPYSINDTQQYYCFLTNPQISNTKPEIIKNGTKRLLEKLGYITVKSIAMLLLSFANM